MHIQIHIQIQIQTLPAACEGESPSARGAAARSKKSSFFLIFVNLVQHCRPLFSPFVDNSVHLTNHIKCSFPLFLFLILHSEHCFRHLWKTVLFWSPNHIKCHHVFNLIIVWSKFSIACISTQTAPTRLPRIN